MTVTLAEIHPSDASAAKPQYDVVIVGFGVGGAALAYGLAKTGRSVAVVEKNLQVLDRNAGEVLQSGGVNALRDLDLESSIEGIEATRGAGFHIYYKNDTKGFHAPFNLSRPYLEKETNRSLSDEYFVGRTLNNGYFVQKLRKAAVDAGVFVVSGNAVDFDHDKTRISGVVYTPTGQSGRKTIRGKVNIVGDGYVSPKFRKLLTPPGFPKPKLQSHFAGLLIPARSKIVDKVEPGFLGLQVGGLHGPKDRSDVVLGHTVYYPISDTESRIIFTLMTPELPSLTDGEVQRQLTKYVRPTLPEDVHAAFDKAIEESTDEKTPGNRRIRSSPTYYLPAFVPGHTPGGILLGDAYNVRHPISGGGMTTVLNDVHILIRRLGGPNSVGDVPARSNPIDLEDWNSVSKELVAWFWERKKVSTGINLFSQATFGTFGLDSPALEISQVGGLEGYKRGSVAGAIALQYAHGIGNVKITGFVKFVVISSFVGAFKLYESKVHAVWAALVNIINVFLALLPLLRNEYVPSLIAAI